MHRFDFDKKNRVLCASFEGVFSLSIFLSAGAETGRHVLDTQPIAVLWDFTDVTSFDASAADVRQMAATSPYYSPSISRFVVAPRDHVYGMVRMFEMSSGATRPDFFTVRSRKEAYRTLGIQDAIFEKLD